MQETVQGQYSDVLLLCHRCSSVLVVGFRWLIFRHVQETSSDKKRGTGKIREVRLQLKSITIADTYKGAPSIITHLCDDYLVPRNTLIIATGKND